VASARLTIPEVDLPWTVPAAWALWIVGLGVLVAGFFFTGDASVMCGRILQYVLDVAIVVSVIAALGLHAERITVGRLEKTIATAPADGRIANIHRSHG